MTWTVEQFEKIIDKRASRTDGLPFKRSLDELDCSIGNRKTRSRNNEWDNFAKRIADQYMDMVLPYENFCKIVNCSDDERSKSASIIRKKLEESGVTLKAVKTKRVYVVKSMKSTERKG